MNCWAINRVHNTLEDTLVPMAIYDGIITPKGKANTPINGLAALVKLTLIYLYTIIGVNIIETTTIYFNIARPNTSIPKSLPVIDAIPIPKNTRYQVENTDFRLKFSKYFTTNITNITDSMITPVDQKYIFALSNTPFIQTAIIISDRADVENIDNPTGVLKALKLVFGININFKSVMTNSRTVTIIHRSLKNGTTPGNELPILPRQVPTW